ncbi:MAG: hypothetical protein EAZ34_09515 [Polaromonas sp.]|nr:MAG: hypothetical protein EAZ34_09515 [Polaromonas sp.]
MARKAHGLPISRVIVLAPTHHIYSFIWGVLLPLVLGVSALDADISALPPLQSGDLMVAAPDQWVWLSASHKSSTPNPSRQNLGSMWPDSVYPTRLISPA